MSLNELWLPPPDLKISEWADMNRQLSSESSAEPGKWTTSRAPYQRAMMDAICESECERVVMMTGAQIGKTEIILNTIGYYVDQEPSPILVLQPTLQLGEDFSKDRLAPMVRDTPCLTGKIADPKSKTSGNTLLHKKFPGGHITIAGANSPVGLASRPIRILLCDEVDRYPASAGVEGDPLSLAQKRTQNFWNRKIIWVSTPTSTEMSRIKKAYDDSTSEEWCVKCPSCGESQAYTWSQIEYRDLAEPLMQCVKCGEKFPGHVWKSQPGEWVASKPEKPTRGFHMNAFASPWVTWQELCAQYEEALNIGPEAVKVWHNTILGLPYDDTSGLLDANSIELRAEEYGAELPEDILLLTAGIDTQDGRLEIEVLGWGLRNETWGVEYHVIYGNPGDSELWAELDEYLMRTWRTKDGAEIGISSVCIDSGGHYTQEVYEFCRTRLRRHIYPIKGKVLSGAPEVTRPTRTVKSKIPLFLLGVNTLKSLLSMRLKVLPGEAGYCHFPSEEHRGYTHSWYMGLQSERMVKRRVNGQIVIRWEQTDMRVRNEPLDCRVYAMGAYMILKPDMNRYVRNKEKLTLSNPKRKKARKTGIMNRGFRV